MIDMPKIQSIRKSRARGDMIAEIARSKGVFEPTVKIYLKKEDFSLQLPVRRTASWQPTPGSAITTSARMANGIRQGRATRRSRCRQCRSSWRNRSGCIGANVADLPGTGPALAGSVYACLSYGDAARPREATRISIHS